MAGRTSIAALLVAGATLDLTPPSPVVPTAAEIAEGVWLEKARRLVAILGAWPDGRDGRE